MRVLFSSTRGAGHLQPLLPYAHALRARGHEVRVAAPMVLGASLNEAGLDHAPFDHPGEEGLGPIWARLHQLPQEEQSAFVVREIFAGLSAKVALPKLLETIRSWRPDLVVRDSAEFASLVGAEAAGVPHARVAVHMPSFEEAEFLPTSEPVDALRRHAELPPDGGAALRAEPVFTAFPSSLENPAVVLRGRAPTRLRMPGGEATAAGGPSRWAPKGETRPLVYITFGTIVGGQEKARAVYRAAMAAVATLPVRALLTLGPSMPTDALGVIPANVQVETWVPQREVLPHVSALLCHGGSGTLLGGLAAGVPVVVAPFGADQPYNAAQIARAGAGVAVLAPELESLRAALVRVLAEAELRSGARRIAEEMAHLPTLEAGLDVMVAR